MASCTIAYMNISFIQDTAGKYRELAAKKCHHVPKPTVELQRPCTVAECPIRTTPPVHRWSTYHRTYPPQPLPQPPPQAEWHSSPWSQVSSLFTSDWHQSDNNPSCPASRYCFLVLCSAQWRVGEVRKPERSSVWSKGSPLLAVPTIWNPPCPRPATPTSALNLRRKVQKLQHNVVLLGCFF